MFLRGPSPYREVTILQERSDAPLLFSATLQWRYAYLGLWEISEGRQDLILDGVLRAGARINPDPRLTLDQAYLIKRSHDTPTKGIKFIYYDF